MPYTIAQIGKALQADVVGDASRKIARASEPAQAGPDDLALAMSPKYADDLGQAQAAVLWPGADWRGLGLKAAVFVARPRMALSGLTAMLDPGQGFGTGIHPTAVIDPNAQIGDDVSIGALSVISAGAQIGAGSMIGPHCVVGVDAHLGAAAFLREMVSIGARVQIGARFIAQAGARIGSDGFSYVTPDVSGVEMARQTMGDQGDTKPQAWIRIHSLGAVQIGDDVEIGANCTIDNGTIRDTVIGDGCKLDNQVHLGHNATVGRDCLIAGQSGLSGSVTLGNNVIMGGQSGVADNTFVGDNAIISGGTKVLSNVPAGRVMMGYPAVKMTSYTDIYKVLRRLPRLARDVAALKKAMFKDDSGT